MQINWQLIIIWDKILANCFSIGYSSRSSRQHTLKHAAAGALKPSESGSESTSSMNQNYRRSMTHGDIIHAVTPRTTNRVAGWSLMISYHSGCIKRSPSFAASPRPSRARACHWCLLADHRRPYPSPSLPPSLGAGSLLLFTTLKGEITVLSLKSLDAELGLLPLALYLQNATEQIPRWSRLSFHEALGPSSL